MADTATEIDLDSVIDRLLEGKPELQILLDDLGAGEKDGKGCIEKKEQCCPYGHRRGFQRGVWSPTLFETIHHAFPLLQFLRHSKLCCIG